MSFKELCNELETAIEDIYNNGITMEAAEKLSAKFLYAQMVLTKSLKDTSLDARMRKSGLKAIRSAVYLEAASKGDKKPTEAALAAIIDTHEVVQGEQQGLDTAEVSKEELERYFDIFENGHIFLRGVAKGNFNG